MLRNEDIKKTDELKTNFTRRRFEVDYILKVIDVFKSSSLLKSFSHFKKKVYIFVYQAFNKSCETLVHQATA